MSVRYFHGAVPDCFDFPTGKPTTNMTEMALPGLAGELRVVINEVRSGQPGGEAIARGVKSGDTDRTIRIIAEALPARAEDDEPLILVSFEEVVQGRGDHDAGPTAQRPDTPGGRDRIAELEDDLHSTREDLSSTIEEMETSNEELKASNVKVMSMNEELQSVNAELATSREELQALNEELTTVNAQLEEKVAEVADSNTDRLNLLTSSAIAVIFLDTEMVTCSFAPAMRGIMRIIDDDVGRPVEDVASRVRDTLLIADANRCLVDLGEVEAEVESLEDRHLIRRARPFRTLENCIEGVVVTHTDVTPQREATLRARMREAQQASLAELGRLALGGEKFDTLFPRAVEDAAANL